MSTARFTTVTRTQGNNRRLKEGVIKPQAFSFNFIEVPVLVHAFRSMVRSLEYDICEMALTTYLCAREHGVRFSALPVFLVRNFHHGAIYYNTRTGNPDPRQLAGKRIGVNRGYTVTTGVWARAILHDEFGVDPGAVTWVLSGDEHVESYVPPANVEPMPRGTTMQDLLLNGDLAAAVGAEFDHPDIAPMIADPFAAGVAALQQRGLYPINHLLVIRDEVLAAHPHLAEEVFELFAESKRLYVEDLQAGRIVKPSAIDKVHLSAMQTLPDPLPYGIEPNRAVLTQLAKHALDQRILSKPVAVEELFVKSTRKLVG